MLGMTSFGIMELGRDVNRVSPMDFGFALFGLEFYRVTNLPLGFGLAQ